MDDDDDMPNIEAPSRGATPAPRDSSASARLSSAAQPSWTGGAPLGGPEPARVSTPGFGATPRPSTAFGSPIDDESDAEAPLRASVASLTLEGFDSWAAPPAGARPDTAASSVWSREVVDGLVAQVDAADAFGGDADDDANGWCCDAALDALVDELVVAETRAEFEPQLSGAAAPYASPLRARNATPRRSVHGSLLTAPSRYAVDGSDGDDALSPLSPKAGFGARRSSVGARSSLGGGDSTSSVARAKRDLAAVADAGIAAAKARAAAAAQRAAAAAAEQSEAERCAPHSLGNCEPNSPRPARALRVFGSADAARPR